MAIELLPAGPGHLDELGRICHLAFNTLHERHRIPPDVPTEEVGRLIIGGVIHREDYTGAVAVENGRIVGSNFVLLADEVCGLGPITVEPGLQAKGVGRALMEWAVGEARRRRGADIEVRLFQEAINTTSLSLYTRIGFRWFDAAALMHPVARASADVRPMTDADLGHVERLTIAHHGWSRRNDAAKLLGMGMPAFVLERAGRVVGYQIATLFGHAAAETNGDLLTLMGHTAASVPPPMAVAIVPLSQGALFDAALGAGARVAKVLNGMSLSSARPMPGPALPSIQV